MTLTRRIYADVPAVVFGNKIKQIRQEYGLTQADFADTLGVSRTYILRLESGCAHPTITLVKLISLIYNYNYEWLLDNEDKKGSV